MSDVITIGAGWFKQSPKGEYISIKLDVEKLKGLDFSEYWMNLVSNNRKSKDTQPDYNLIATPKQRTESRGSSAPQYPKPRNTFPAKNQSHDDDDLPF